MVQEVIGVAQCCQVSEIHTASIFRTEVISVNKMFMFIRLWYTMEGKTG
jgi:hypothetical protein